MGQALKQTWFLRKNTYSRIINLQHDSALEMDQPLWIIWDNIGNLLTMCLTCHSWGFPCFIRRLDSSLPPTSRVLSWIHNIFFPNILQNDATWLREHESHCFSWLSDAQLERKMLTILATANWSKRDWLYVRAWYLATLSGQPPFAICGRNLVPQQSCPFCSYALILEHVTFSCAFVDAAVCWFGWNISLSLALTLSSWKLSFFMSGGALPRAFLHYKKMPLL